MISAEVEGSEDFVSRKFAICAELGLARAGDSDAAEVSSKAPLAVGACFPFVMTIHTMKVSSGTAI